MPDIHGLATLAGDLQRLDVEVPADLTHVLALRDVLFAAVHAEDPVAELFTAAESGKLTPANAGKLVNKAALARATLEHSRAIARELELPLSRLGTAALRDSGDDLVTALRPSFDTAIAGIQTAAQFFTADAHDSDILAAGPEAAAAWQQLGDHRTVADLVFSIRTALARSRYGVTEPVPALFLASPPDLDIAVNVFGDDRGPGGRWHRLIDAGVALHLNTAAEVEALIAEHGRHTERQAAEMRARLYNTPQHRSGLEADKAWVDFNLNTQTAGAT